MLPTGAASVVIKLVNHKKIQNNLPVAELPVQPKKDDTLKLKNTAW